MYTTHDSVVLYHAPPSFYSQIARLALAEKGVAYEDRLVIPGPPSFETYEPWYLRLNPGGTVPTLVVDGAVVDDSRRILAIVDDLGPGPPLSGRGASTTAETVEQLVDLAYGFPERELAYGGKARRLGQVINWARRRRLSSLAKRVPELRSLYLAKLADIEAFSTRASDEARTAALVARYDAALDAIEVLLEAANSALGPAYLAGPQYSLADVVWTVAIARQHMLGFTPLHSRPALSRWYAAMKARPTFRAADVWERFSPLAVPRVILRKLGRTGGPAKAGD